MTLKYGFGIDSDEFHRAVEVGPDDKCQVSFCVVLKIGFAQHLGDGLVFDRGIVPGEYDLSGYFNEGFERRWNGVER